MSSGEENESRGQADRPRVSAQRSANTGELPFGGGADALGVRVEMVTFITPPNVSTRSVLYSAILSPFLPSLWSDDDAAAHHRSDEESAAECAMPRFSSRACGSK